MESSDVGARCAYFIVIASVLCPTKRRTLYRARNHERDKPTLVIRHCIAHRLSARADYNGRQPPLAPSSA